jgi:YD repeat-containing protein
MTLLSSEYDTQGRLTRSTDVTAGTTTIRDGAGAVTASRPATPMEAAIVGQLETETTRASIKSLVATAIANNRTYLAIATPTAAQSTAQVRSLTQQLIRIERLLGEVLDGTD